jgi:acetyl/propionyl-CoA carboxylase alpha subunit
MIESVLIANRGEIARRIIRTARRMGVRTIAVYSEADADAPHVREADEAVLIGPAPARESYLVAERILDAAKQTGAAAIHPGYGFLSENAGFARAVIDAGLVWVGPPPAAIDAMGLKDAAKQRMADAGVPVTPGYLGEDQSPGRLQTEADAIGYPVLIKAVAGGGGKGMRKVLAAEDFAAALASCQREAASSFGDDRVLIEKYVTRPRHIEVQVFGDSHGNVVHLFERDCSLQRRHQKVIEEAPAPGMDEATRAAVCDAAVKAARAVNYEGAGTIEFIADASEGLRADRIWFMEMNTRLQVEHPVTEMITGQDLVEWQLWVASGEPLPLRQDQITMSGWAMEARLYAENPATGFLPSTGTLEHFKLPETTLRADADDEDYGIPSRIRSTRLVKVSFEPDGGEAMDEARMMAWAEPGPWWPLKVRVDSAVEEGGEVSPFYDPMIAKLIVHASDRSKAAVRLAQACQSVEVWPVKVNSGFLARCANHPEFLAGDVDTGFIDRHLAALVQVNVPERVEIAAIGLAADETHCGPHNGDNVWVSDADGLYGFRLNGPSRALHATSINGARLVGESTTARRGDSTWLVGGGSTAVPVRVQHGRIDVGDGPPLSFHRDGDRFVVFAGGECFMVDPAAAHDFAAGDDASDGSILSPMPGKVVSVSVKAGESVTKGQTLLVLEAMKMEHALTAPFDGVVAELSATAGGQVSEGVVLVRLDAA